MPPFGQGQIPLAKWLARMASNLGGAEACRGPWLHIVQLLLGLFVQR